MQLLVLIIATDDCPLYVELQRLWKKQFSIHPEIDMFFLKCDPTQEEEAKVSGDTISAKCVEDRYYGIIKKTLVGIKVMYQKKQYDYVLRTNLSSFYVFPTLLEILALAPTSNYFAGVQWYHENIRCISGAGMMMSRDIALHIMDKLDQIWNPNIKYDDVCISAYIDSIFFQNKEFQQIPRYDFITPYIPSMRNVHTFLTTRKNCPHFRIKLDPYRDPLDLQLRKFLLNVFYPTLATH